MPTVTITLLNQKGGVGKTSSCFHLGGTLAKSGRRVLLIDNDPQASLTQGFFGPDTTAALPPPATVAAIYEPNAAPAPEAIVRPTGFDRLAIVPGSASLTAWNLPPCEAWIGAQDGIRSFVRELTGEFDLVLIDCPPNLHLCSWAALVAADAIIVPLQAEDFGSQGLAPVQASIRAVQSGPNPRLSLAGYLLSMFDRRLSVHLAYESLLRETHGPAVFDATIPRAKDYVEAVASRQPVAWYKPRGAAAKAVAAVVDELVARVGLTAAEVARGAA